MRACVCMCVSVYFMVFEISCFISEPQTLSGLFDGGTYPGSAVVYPAPTTVRACVPKKGKPMFLCIEQEGILVLT